MNKNCFEILRGGLHSTFQDNGFSNVQHLGITTGGVVDNDLFRLGNKIVNNELHTPAIEFVNYGPKLIIKKGKCRFVITGNVIFNILRGDTIVEGISNRSYILNEGDSLDILSTIKSNYGYLVVEGGFTLTKHFGCSSTLIQSQIGPNMGKKISDNQLVYFNKDGTDQTSSLDYNPYTSENHTVRVMRGPQMNYFMQKVIKNFYSKPFIVSNKISRIGVKIENNTIFSIKSHNIFSEGIIKGSIQVPGNGNPIILMAEHPSIGGYPKIATVILADIAKIAQFPVGTQFNFKEVSLSEAQKIYIEKNKSFKSLLDAIRYN